MRARIVALRYPTHDGRVQLNDAERVDGGWREGWLWVPDWMVTSVELEQDHAWLLRDADKYPALTLAAAGARTTSDAAKRSYMAATGNCVDCGKHFDTDTGLAVHQRRWCKGKTDGKRIEATPAR